MINKKLKKALAYSLIASTLIPSAIFAKTFDDVTKTGKYAWAYPYIDEMSDKGVIKGQGDGKFYPDNPVSFEETLQLIKGVVNPSQYEIDEALKKYKQDCIDNGVADWALESVSFALYRDIIDTKQLKQAKEVNFLGTSNKTYPARSNIALFFAKGLALSENGDLSLLEHKDKDQIDSFVKGYLASLVKANIFEPTGSDGKFDGKRSIKRSEMAKITKRSYDYVADHPIKSEIKKAKGKILIASKINDNNLIIVEIDNNTKLSFTIDSKSEFKLNNKTINFSDLKTGQEVEFEYYVLKTAGSEGVIKSMDVKNTAITAIGYVDNIYNNSVQISYKDVPEKEEDKVKDFRSYYKFTTKEKKTFNLDKEAKLYIYDKKVNLNDIKSGDMIEFKTDVEGNIKEAFIYPQKATVSGKVQYVNDNADSGYVKLRLSDNKDYIFYITRNTSNIGMPRQDDQIQLDLNYRVINGLNKQTTSDNIGQVTYFRAPNYNYGFNNTDKGSIEIRDRNGRNYRFDLDQYTRYIDINNNSISLSNIVNSIQNKYVSLDVSNNVVRTIKEINNIDNNFNAMAQILSAKNNQTSNRGRYEITLRILQSDNNRITPGNNFSLYTDDWFNEKQVLDIKGYVTDRNEIEQASLNPIGHPNVFLRYDRTIKNHRDFIPYQNLGEDYSNR